MSLPHRKQNNRILVCGAPEHPTANTGRKEKRHLHIVVGKTVSLLPLKTNIRAGLYLFFSNFFPH